MQSCKRDWLSPIKLHTDTHNITERNFPLLAIPDRIRDNYINKMTTRDSSVCIATGLRAGLSGF